MKDKEKPKNLEDYEPGATRGQIFKDLKKVAEAKKPKNDDDSPPEQVKS